MDNSILTAIVTALAALFGVALNSYFTHRGQNQDRIYRLQAAAEEHTREIYKHERQEAIKSLQEIHITLSHIQRECSLTNVDIMWRSKISETEYDNLYTDTCAKLDRVCAKIGVYEPSMVQVIEELDGQMNIFWGRFKQLIYRTSLGKEPHELMPELGDTQEAAKKVGQLAAKGKNMIQKKMKEFSLETK